MARKTEAAGVYRIRRIVTPTLGELFLILVLPSMAALNPIYRPDHENEPPSSPFPKISERTGTGALAVSSWRHQQLREPRGGKEHARTNGGTPIYT